MKFFNKILLSVISIFAIANSTSHSMDDKCNGNNLLTSNNHNNNSTRSNSVDNYHNSANYIQYRQLDEQEKNDINKAINNILSKMTEYSNDLLKVNKYYLHNLDIKLYREIKLIKEVKIPEVDGMKNKSSSHYDKAISILSDINSSKLSINNLEKRIKIIEDKLGIKNSNININLNKFEMPNNNGNKTQNVTDINILNRQYSNNNHTNKYKQLILHKNLDIVAKEPENNFLVNSINSIKELNKNIDLNLTNNDQRLIQTTNDEMEQLREQYMVLHNKILILKECINSCEIKSNQINKQSRENIEKLSKLRNRLHNIIETFHQTDNFQFVRNTRAGNKHYFNDYSIMNENKLGLILDRPRNKTDEIEKAENNVINEIKQKNIFGLIDEFRYKYPQFKFKQDTITALRNMNLKLRNAYKNSKEHTKNLKKDFSSMMSQVSKDRILELNEQFKRTAIDIDISKGVNAEYQGTIQVMQQKLCDIESELNIKQTIGRKYENILGKYKNLMYETEHLQGTIETISNEREQLRDKLNNIVNNELNNQEEGNNKQIIQIYNNSGVNTTNVIKANNSDNLEINMDNNDKSKKELLKRKRNRNSKSVDETKYYNSITKKK